MWPGQDRPRHPEAISSITCGLARPRRLQGGLQSTFLPINKIPPPITQAFLGAPTGSPGLGTGTHNFLLIRQENIQECQCIQNSSVPANGIIKIALNESRFLCTSTRPREGLTFGVREDPEIWSLLAELMTLECSLTKSLFEL